MADIRRTLIGEPIATSQAIHQRLSKLKALAVFSSDALSSSAYATEAILLVLVGVGTGALAYSWPIALAIAGLLMIVSFSYFQTIHAYPNGGGAYIVAKENLGVFPGLTAAASLLIDYVLTVAVSVSAGVAALTSAFPALVEFRVPIAILIVAFITLMNLRGVKESGTFFSIPTYGFIVGIFAMVLWGLLRLITGNVPAPHEGQVITDGVIGATQGLTLFIILRAFAAGCTALTGVEAISNGIPAFKPPESKHAGQTLIVMVVILSALFLGITFLANHFPIEVHAHGGPTVLAQLSAEVFGDGSVLFYYVQFATLFILSLAANTAYADFPRLASLISKDRYLPRQLTNFGDRLVYSNGIILLAVLASVLIFIFDAREHNLLPLYAVGVFISFTLSQSGMVIHWLNDRKKPHFVMTGNWRFKLGMNALGAVLTFVVGIVLMVTKFTEGAWLVIVAIPILIAGFLKIHQHYIDVAKSLTLDGLVPTPPRVARLERNHAPLIVLMNSLNRCSLQALEYGMQISDNVRAVAISVEPAQIDILRTKWRQWHLTSVPLDVIPSPYREITEPLLKYLHERDEADPEELPTIVVVPEFVVHKWWEKFLHNGTTNVIRAALYRDQIERGHGRPVIFVPYRIGDMLYQPDIIGRERPTSTPAKPTAPAHGPESKPPAAPGGSTPSAPTPPPASSNGGPSSK
ncbi:MAG: APC family permease [Chloroflexi bacterium]|nr:APC family permease [Chloroflexota bacterium]